MNIHNDEGKPVRMAFTVSSERVQHYSDVIEYMTTDATNKYVAKYKRQPSPQSVAFYKKEMIRLVTIQHDLKRAREIEINPSHILNE